MIICLWGRNSIGKTGGIRALWKELNSGNVPLLHEQGCDLCATVQYNGLLVGLASQGDPYSLQEDWLAELIDKSCDVIVCASRSKGETVGIVKKYAKENNYELIWLSPLYVSAYNTEYRIEELYEFLNETTAHAVRDIINNFVKNN